MQKVTKGNFLMKRKAFMFMNEETSQVYVDDKLINVKIKN